MTVHMTDKAFIGYCECHSQTERALFHVKDLHRILFLAGERDPVRVPEFEEPPSMGDFRACHWEQMEPLCKKARERKREVSDA